MAEVYITCFGARLETPTDLYSRMAGALPRSVRTHASRQPGHMRVVQLPGQHGLAEAALAMSRGDADVDRDDDMVAGVMEEDA